MEWVSYGELACVLQNGLVLLFRLRGPEPVELHLKFPHRSTTDGIQLAACQFSKRSVVVQVARSNELFAVADIANPTCVALSSLRLKPTIQISAIVCRSQAGNAHDDLVRVALYRTC